MFARVGTYHGAPGRVQEGTHIVNEIKPEVQAQQGFQQAYLFVDDKSGKAMSMSLWDTEEDVNRSASFAGGILGRIANALGAGKPTVEILEVGSEFGPHRGAGRFVRVSSYRGSPAKVQNTILEAQNTESSLNQLPGFQQAFFLVDRKSGRAMTMTFWESEEAVKRTSSGATTLRGGISQALGATGQPEVEVFEVVGDIQRRMTKAA